MIDGSSPVNGPKSGRGFSHGPKPPLNLSVVAASLVLVGGAITMLIPFLWMLSTSLSHPSLLFSRESRLIPRRYYVVSSDKEVRVEPLRVELTSDNGARIEHASVVPDPTHQTTVAIGEDTFGISRYQVRVSEESGEYQLGEELWFPANDLQSSVWLYWKNYLDLIRSSNFEKVPDSSIPKFHFLARFSNWIKEPNPPVRVDFLMWVYNSFKITLLSTLGTLLSCSMAAYALVVLRIPLGSVIFGILLATLMIPVYVTLIPIYVFFSRIGWVDTHLPLIVPAFLGNAFGVFLLRQFFLGLPRDLFEAAKIDGAGAFTIYWRIVLPLSKPALATLTIFTFMGHWNNLVGPLIYLNSPEKMNLTAGLVYFQSSYLTLWHWLMAGSLLSVIPMLLMFFFMQQYFVRGVALSGLKG